MPPTHDGQLEQLLARLPVAERVRLIQQLDAASVAVWQVRRRLNAAASAHTSVTEWCTYLQTALEALSAIDGLVATVSAPPGPPARPHKSRPGPRSSPTTRVG